MRISLRLARLALTLALVFLAGGLAGAVLVRWAPGFEADERELHQGLASGSIEAIRRERAADRDIAAFYWRHLRGMAAGDFGESRSLQVPVLDLVAERLPVTARLAGYGLLAGWLTGWVAAAAAGLVRLPGAGAAASALSVLVSSFPVALLAFAALFWQLPVWLCVAAAIFPRVYRYTRNAFDEQASRLAVVAARARGVPPWRVLACYVVAPTAARTFALAGVTVSVALGAAVPVEVLAGVPGIGQLVWKAASGRDLPVLVTLTMLVTAVTLTANAVADLGVAWWEGAL